MSTRVIQAAVRLALVCAVAIIPSRAFAQGEVTGVIGGLLGGDLNNLVSGTSSLSSAFDNGPLYGLRVGYIVGVLGVEGSYVTSPSGVSIQAPGGRGSLDARVSYGEGNVLLMLIPGPVAPFLSIGAGWHSYDFDVDVANVPDNDRKVEKFGWNWGGGLKINIKALTLRGEVRDHITNVGPVDFQNEAVADAVGVTNDVTLHNVEISGGIGIRF